MSRPARQRDQTPVTERIDFATSDITATAPNDYDAAAGELDIRPDLNAIVVMPCVGSGVAGQVMTFSYLFTATLT